MYCYVCYHYVLVALKNQVWDINFMILDTYQTDTLYLREQVCEDPWLFFEVKRGSRGEKKIVKHCFNTFMSASVHCRPMGL